MDRDAGSATPVDFMSNEGSEQNSIGKAITNDSSSPLRSDEKVRSRYLSPHMASCHDYCKYGKKQDSEAEERRLNFRKFLKKQKKSARHAEHNEVTILVAEGRRMKTGEKPKSTSKGETELPDDTEVSKSQTPRSMKSSSASGEKKSPRPSLATGRGIKSTVTSDLETEHPSNNGIPKPETPPPVKNSSTSDKKKMLQTSPGKSRAKSINSGDGKKVKVIRGGTPSTPSQSEPSIASDIETSDQLNICEEKAKSIAKKPISSVVPKLIPQQESPSGSESQKLKPKLPPMHKRVDSDGKPAITLKTKAPLIRSLSQRKSSRGPSASNVAPPLHRRGDSDGKPAIALKAKAPLLRSLSQRKSSRGPSAPTVPPPPLHRRVDSAGKPAIALKVKAPLIRSLSQRKSLKGLITRRIQESMVTKSPVASRNGGSELSTSPTVSLSSDSGRKIRDSKIVKNLETSKNGERKQLKPTPASISSKTQDSASRVQLRKLRSTKRNPTPHESAWSSQLRKLRSVKRNSTPQDSVSSLQPKKLRSVKQSSTPNSNVSSLQPRKLRSIKQTSAPHGSDSSLPPRELGSAKHTSMFRGLVSRLQSGKLRSMKRNSSVKDGDKIEKASLDSKSGDEDIDPNPKTKESESTIHGTRDRGKEGNRKFAISKDDEKRRSRRTTAVPPRPEDNTSAPFLLKFKRGKVINLRSDSMGARRLWFNIGLLAGDNPNSSGLSWRKSFRRKSIKSIDLKGPDSEVQSVVLKHQGVTEKKDSNALFNHVIEETASKLVETRKSKVKALVGAFETVISLQESKPSLTV